MSATPDSRRCDFPSGASATLSPCRAHFVGLNCRAVPWDYHDRPATEWITENWANHRRELYERVALAIE